MGLNFSAAFCGLVLSFAHQLAWSQTQDSTPDTTVGFSVSSFGASSYRIPIQVPPGVANMAPKLELVYNSQNGDGVLGIGWALAGIPAVARCPSTKATDGVMRGVKLDSEDKYCLGNSRLISIPSGQSEVEFRRELDDFSSIKFANNAFTERTKAGTTWEYGGTEDSRIEAQGKTAVREWAVSAIRDIRGNYQTFKYTEDSVNGQYQLDQISYGGRAQAPLASVRFEYEERRDVTTRWLSGSFSKATKRMSKIKTYVGNSLVREYRIGYAAQPTTLDRTKLVSVTECEATGKCLRPVVVEWSGGSPALGGLQDLPGTLNTWGEQSCAVTDVLDMNGDGAPDIVCVYYSGQGINTVFVRLNNGGNFSDWQVFSPAGGSGDFFFQRCRLLELNDINSDGFPDLICVQMPYGGMATYVQLNDGTRLTGWQIYSPKSTSLGSSQDECHTVKVADINSDGRADIVCIYSNQATKSKTAVQLNTGTSLGAWQTYSTDSGTPNAYVTRCALSQIIDMTGDGMRDVICVAVHGTNDSKTYIQINSGSGLSDWQEYSESGVGVNLSYCKKMLTADINGDRLPDIACVYGVTGDGWFGPNDGGQSQTYVQINNGVKLQGWKTWDSVQGTVNFSVNRSCDLIDFVDMNNDNLPDIVCAGYVMGSIDDNGTHSKDYGAHIKFNNGIHFLDWQRKYFTPAGAFATKVMDVNFDGLPDIVMFRLPFNPFAIGGVVVSTQLSSGLVPVATPPNLVVSVRNGVFKRQVEYKPLSSSTVYTKDSGQNRATFPKMDYVPPAFVVSKVHELSGVGASTDHQRMWTYTYGGLKAELGSGRGILGFRWMKTVDHAADLETYTEFSQDFPYLGYPMLTELSGNRWASVPVGLLKRTKYRVVACINPVNGTTCTVSPGNRYFPYVAEIQEDSWDTKFNELTNLNTRFSYVSDVGGQFFGDVGSIVVRYSDGATSTTTNEYYPANTSNWILGRVKKTVVQNYKP